MLYIRVLMMIVVVAKGFPLRHPLRAAAGTVKVKKYQKISEQRHKKIEIFVERIHLDYHEEQASTGSQEEVSQRR
jgi:hypothetical protein